MNKQGTELEKLFQQLTEGLQSAQKWETEPPPPSVLLSEQPFAVDTLEPEQWLQWIFIPKMRHLIAQNQPFLPGCSITPYFEQVWSGEVNAQSLLPIIRAIDEVCSEC